MRQLLADAASGRIEPGAMLPREVDLAERFDVSRGVVRDTVQALREREVVAVRHGSGARLLPEERWNLLDEEVLAVLVTRPDRAGLRGEIVECLLRLEPEAAALAAERAREPDREALDRHLVDLRGEDGLAGYVTEDPRVRAQAAFHDRVMAAGGNRPLRQMTRPLHVGLAVMTHAFLNRSRRAQLVARHRDVVDAVRAEDPGEARRALEGLLGQIGEWVVSGRARPRLRR